MMYRPKAAAEVIGIGPSTLRAWSHMFAELLGTLARPHGRERRYTEQDIGVFRRAKALLDGGLTFDQARVQLERELQAWPGSFGFRSPTDDQVAALAAQVEALQVALAAQAETIQSVVEQRDLYRELLHEARVQLHLAQAIRSPRS